MQFKELFTHDALIFLKKFIKNPLTVGSVTPSSKALASEITRHVGEGKIYLEVGPGTGVFTKDIVSKLNPTDKLDLVELDPHFCELLKKQYDSNKQVEVFEGSIIDWKPSYQYDVIVSSIPLNALKKDLVEQILIHYQQLIKSGGVISYFEYMGLPELKKLLLVNHAKEEYKQTLELLSQFINQYEVGSEKIWGNLPPALVHHCVIQ